MKKTRVNETLREYAEERKVPLYLVAYHMGRSCDWMTRKIRLPLPDDEIEEFKSIIDEIVEQREREGE